MGNEIVKYNNDFNNQALRNFSSEELNLLVTFFHKLKEKGTDVLEYSFYELKKLIMLEKNMNIAQNIYGDGNSAAKCIEIICDKLK